MVIRLVAWVVIAAGCGRLGFDPANTTSTTDAAIDAPLGAPCTTDLECGRCARCEGTCRAEPIVDVFLGHRSTCYVGSGGTRWCTGENNDGQLGLGDTTNRSTPARIADGDQWERIYLFFYGAATGVRQGQFFTWGNGVLLPTATGPSRDVRAALGDLRQRCFWELDGTSTCPGSGATVWRSLDHGADHTCGVMGDGTLWCWGTSYSDALGNAALDDGDIIAAPAQVGTDTDWVQVGTGGNSVARTGSTCARKTNGEILCFGHPNLTGTNGVDVGATPTLIGNSDTGWDWLEVDWEHACAGKVDGSVWCWGADTYGGYVAPGLMTALAPTRIAGTFERWLMGGHHACGQSGGRWRCMGWNQYGQLGDGTITGTGNLVDLCP